MRVVQCSGVCVWCSLVHSCIVCVRLKQLGFVGIWCMRRVAGGGSSDAVGGDVGGLSPR